MWTSSKTYHTWACKFKDINVLITSTNLQTKTSFGLPILYMPFTYRYMLFHLLWNLVYNHRYNYHRYWNIYHGRHGTRYLRLVSIHQYLRIKIKSNNKNYHVQVKQEACSGVHSACQAEKWHKWTFIYNCSGRGNMKWLTRDLIKKFPLTAAPPLN